jgi:hypothetical protein
MLANAMMKDHILQEIVRTAATNSGAPLGYAKFASETGIKYSDWNGKYWARWSDAVIEAGLAPNQLRSAYEAPFLLNRLAELAQELGRLPAPADLRLKARADKTFPSHTTFERLGKKTDLVRQLTEYCRSRAGYEHVVRLCEEYASRIPQMATAISPQSGEIAFVYLIKSGRFYKIGRTNSAGRREREIVIQLPEKAGTIHTIRTDDPCGIEDYWHRRFARKRKNGEWFELDAADIAAFKRRKFM